MVPSKSLAVVLALLAGPVLAAPAFAGTIHVAVAANVTEAATEIAAAFAEKTGDEAVLSFGSTGQLYAQITQGAPFDVFLAADTARPGQILADGLGVEGSRFTYAVGRLVLWSREAGMADGEAALKAADFDRIAICNPAAAPYGAAAVETMKALGVHEALQPKIVEGANVAQAFQFVDTGNAEVGFVALSQVIGRDDGSAWIVPQHLHAPIRQDAVVLKSAADPRVAAAFAEFLKGPEAAAILERFGYAAAGGG
jgi:molybdenum ABC transporter, periplasmic molybdate-binding protein